MTVFKLYSDIYKSDESSSCSEECVCLCVRTNESMHEREERSREVKRKAEGEQVQREGDKKK